MIDYSKEILEILTNIHFFDLLNEEQLSQISEQLITVFFKNDETIYSEGSEADGIYIVVSGRVSLQQEKQDGFYEIAICQKGDFFGEEGLSSGNLRAVSAKTLTNVVAIHFDQNKLEEIYETFPEIIQSINLSIKSYKLSLKQRFKWLSPREAVHFLARKHPFIFWYKSFLPFILSLLSIFLFINFYFFSFDPKPWLSIFFGIIALISSGWFMWIWVDWTNDFSIVTNRRIILLDKVALFYESRQEAPIDAILSVELNSSQLGRWIGYGDVIIRTFTGVIIFKQLAKPDLVIRLLNDEKGKSLYQRNKLQRITKEELLRHRIGINSNQNPENDPDVVDTDEEAIEDAPELDSSGLMNSLARFFGLRTQKKDRIIYRTHWFMLIKKAFWAGLSLFLLFTIMIYSFIKLSPSDNFDGVIIIEIGIGIILTLWWLYQYWDWRNDKYIITPDQLIDVYKKPLGQEVKRSSLIRNIQTVEFKRLGVISLILNFGTVSIRVGDTTLTFDYVYNPSKVQQDIFDHYQRYIQSQKQKEQEAIRDEVADWIGVYHQVVQKNPETEHQQTDDDDSGYNIGELGN